MKVRVYGFRFDPALVPTAMSRTSVFSYMEAHAGEKLGKSYRFGAHRVSLPCGGGTQEWIAGMMLRIRDSQAYTTITESEGKDILTAEDLGVGKKLAEVSFFLVHPETGNGLITHHYHAVSIWGFGRVCTRLFNLHRKQIKTAALTVPGLDTKQKKQITKGYAGKLELGQLSNDTDLKKLVSELKRVSSMEVSFTTVKTKELFLRGISQRAESEKIKFLFPKDADVDELADELDGVAKGDDVEDLKVSGYDNAGKAREYHLEKNPLVFDEYDYDRMMKGLRIDLSDWPGSIKKSAIIAGLGKVAAGNSVLTLLKKT